MRKLKLHYRDKECPPTSKFSAGPYMPSEAKIVANHLEKMGCYDFKYEPIRELT